MAGYGTSTAVLLVTGSRLGDQFGRRRVFALGLALFVVTSAACALAPDPAVLVAARVAQGVGAALMAPNILSILHGYGLAFERSVLQMGVLLLAVAALTRLMPGRQETA